MREPRGKNQTPGAAVTNPLPLIANGGCSPAAFESAVRLGVDPRTLAPDGAWQPMLAQLLADVGAAAAFACKYREAGLEDGRRACWELLDNSPGKAAVSLSQIRWELKRPGSHPFSVTPTPFPTVWTFSLCLLVSTSVAGWTNGPFYKAASAVTEVSP